MFRRTLFVALLLALATAARDAAPPALAAVAHPDRWATLPAVSPDGRLVVYARDFAADSSELRVIGIDGSGDRAFCRLDHGAGPPGWMDRGRRVTQVHSFGDTAVMWSIGLARGDRREEARVAGKSLSLSNDGRRLAFAVGDWRNGVLTVADARGLHPRALSDTGAGWFNFAWSPDDRTIAATRLERSGDLQVWLVDVASGRTRALTAFPRERGRPQWPAWSPDGKRVAVQAGSYDRERPENSTSDLWVIEAASGKATRLPIRDGTWMDETPSYARDGRIVFQSTRGDRFEIWSANADGSGVRKVTP